VAWKALGNDGCFTAWQCQWHFRCSHTSPTSSTSSTFYSFLTLNSPYCSVRLLVSHSSATLKLPKMYRLKRRKLSLPKPSGRGLRLSNGQGEAGKVGRREGGSGGKSRRVVRSTFSASMRVYFTAKAFTNEWLSASSTPLWPPLLLIRLPLPSPHSPLAFVFTFASSGLRLRQAAFCWAFVLDCGLQSLKGKRNHDAYFLDSLFSFRLPQKPEDKKKTVKNW